MTGKGPAAPGTEPEAVNSQQLREANERLVLATLHAQTLATASGQAAARVQEANEHLVIATIQAQRRTELAEQASQQLAYRTELEVKLLEAQKLETLAVLAGGVAHDFNNLITTIMGYADLGRMAAPPGSDMAYFFKGIDQATTKAGELTRQLMAYAGKGTLHMEEVDLGIVVQEIAHLFGVSLRKDVSLHCDLADRIPFIKGDPTQIFQIAMNLLSNAAEACPSGHPGRITLETRTREVDAATLASGGWLVSPPPGRYATLTVTDNGIGMAPETLERVLEPFFTTKPTGHGLGLAATTGILRGHGGGLRVSSELGHGSSFTLFLPALAGSRSQPGPGPPAWRGEGKLLLVEPEPEARRVARHLAEQVGFTVLAARNGPEALKLFRLHPGAVALVVMALDLPGMDGRETSLAMQAIDPHVPVVLNLRFDTPDPGLPGSGMQVHLRTPFRAAEFQGLLQRTLSPAPTGPG